jgi:hypothetical protein
VGKHITIRFTWREHRTYSLFSVTLIIVRNVFRVLVLIQTHTLHLGSLYYSDSSEWKVSVGLLDGDLVYLVIENNKGVVGWKDEALTPHFSFLWIITICCKETAKGRTAFEGTIKLEGQVFGRLLDVLFWSYFLLWIYVQNNGQCSLLEWIYCVLQNCCHP